MSKSVCARSQASVKIKHNFIGEVVERPRKQRGQKTMSKPKHSRQTQGRLSDLVKAAHKAGAQVSVSLVPKTKPIWHVSYIASTGKVVAMDVITELGVMEIVARMLNLEATSINIQRGHYGEVA